MKEEFHVKKMISSAPHMFWKSTSKLEMSMVVAENRK